MVTVSRARPTIQTSFPRTFFIFRSGRRVPSNARRSLVRLPSTPSLSHSLSLCLFRVCVRASHHRVSIHLSPISQTHPSHPCMVCHCTPGQYQAHSRTPHTITLPASTEVVYAAHPCCHLRRTLAWSVVSQPTLLSSNRPFLPSSRGSTRHLWAC
ncbi:uncharacterized protein LY79DRAFT_208068 [Colletotrichum navitas]|uniref:Uncharacterized protein n=1 Tax=Colletotrichum navitas TaxID=681940 RepID=A0AAD8QBT6_9PEZI|nr:uncharacterized protein LY79DRAFT_208068 [Colletotrichum navitas]KAK1599096.1 hypothetical protein LY79DRAFT_208068 [Colletotrichum navitas]